MNAATTPTTTTPTIAPIGGRILPQREVDAITGNDRWNKGNTYDRRARKGNLLRHWGDGTTCACVWCGRQLVDRGEAASGAGLPDHITVDHIVCHTDGGRYTLKNLVPACDRCNKSRGATTFDRWAAHVGRNADAIREHAASYRKRSPRR